MPNPPEPIFSMTSNVSVSFVKLRRSWSRSENSEESSVELKSILGWFVLGELEMNFEVLMAVKFALFTTWRWRHSWISSSSCFSSWGFSCLTDFFSSLKQKLLYWSCNIWLYWRWMKRLDLTLKYIPCCLNRCFWPRSLHHCQLSKIPDQRLFLQVVEDQLHTLWYQTRHDLDKYAASLKRVLKLEHFL